MKKAVFAALFLSLVGALAAVPAVADSTVYTSGSSTWEFDSWDISFGSVTDEFTLNQAETITGFTIDVWISSGDPVTSVDYSFGTTAYGTSLATGTATTTGALDVPSNSYGYAVYTETASSIAPVSLAAGTYWFTLQNAVWSDGEDVSWDENDGRSIGYDISYGPIAAFDCTYESECGLSGGETFTLTGNSSTSPVPEPGSLLLLGTGLAGLAGLLRRKIAKVL